jgi:hypothetical protein
MANDLVQYSDTKKDIIKIFEAGARPHMDELWGLVRSMCNPGKG